MECLLPYLSMVTVPHTTVGLERMLDYKGVGLKRFHCMWNGWMWSPKDIRHRNFTLYQLVNCM